MVRKYRPDFLVRLTNGETLVLETKGEETEQDQVKRRYLEEWVAAANAHGGFGRWRAAVARQTGQVWDNLSTDSLRRVDKAGSALIISIDG